MKRTPNVEKVLRSLRDDGPTYGLALAERIGMRWPTVYRVLARMRDAHWIVEQLRVASDGAQRWYELTDDGRAMAELWLADASGDHVGRYRQKATHVRAIRWTGENFAEVESFVGARLRRDGDVLWIRTVDDNEESCHVGWWIREGVDNPYPVPPHVFEAMVEIPR